MKPKKHHIYRYTKVAIACTLFWSMTSCTKDFVEMNTNPAGVTDQQANADYTLISTFLHQAQRFIIPEEVGEYQLANNLSSDVYAGYFTPPTPFAANANNVTYNLMPGWNAAAFNNKYIKTMNPIYKVEQFTRDASNLRDIFGFAKILKVAAMHRVSDKVGPIIYSNYNKPNATDAIEYDSQEQAYNNFFTDLDTATSILQEHLSKAVSPAMRKADLSYSTDNYQHWLKVANALRLRLAIRIAYINPTLAKTQGEKALAAASGGLLETIEDNCFITTSVDHPLNIITQSWADTRMSASIESILGGYQDPRLEKMFDKAKDPAVAGQYKGIRAGVNIDAKTRYEGYSALLTQPNKIQLMTAAEVYFLKAEAALRGWANAGDAKNNYETGIKRSFEQYALASNATAYISNDSYKMKPYIDPNAINSNENNIPAGSPLLSDITIKWGDNDSNTKKLERIITQKWIAIFPDGDEAWAEYRRTGFPKLFPNVLNFSAGQIPTVPGIRRLPFPQREYNSNSAAVATAVQLLNGPDHGGTRLWWDVVNKNL